MQILSKELVARAALGLTAEHPEGRRDPRAIPNPREKLKAYRPKHQPHSRCENVK